MIDEYIKQQDYIHTDVNESTFCGLDLKSGDSCHDIKEAIDFIINQTYSVNKI